MKCTILLNGALTIQRRVLHDPGAMRIPRSLIVVAAWLSLVSPDRAQEPGTGSPEISLRCTRALG